MPYQSTAQRGFIHAKASEGVPWAKKFTKEADRMPQPTKKHKRKKHIRKVIHKSMGPPDHSMALKNAKMLFEHESKAQKESQSMKKMMGHER